MKFARKLLQSQPFFTDWFSVTLALKIPSKSADFFRESVSENPAKFDFFFRDLFEAPKFEIVENDWSLKHFVYADWENQQVGSLMIWNSQ